MMMIGMVSDGLELNYDLALRGANHTSNLIDGGRGGGTYGRMEGGARLDFYTAPILTSVQDCTNKDISSRHCREQLVVVQLLPHCYRGLWMHRLGQGGCDEDIPPGVCFCISTPPPSDPSVSRYSSVGKVSRAISSSHR